MIKFDILTLFPEAFSGYFSQSILKKAQEKKLVKINIYNLRNFATDKHKTVDGYPYGGGAGMVLKIEPIFRGLVYILKKTKKIPQNKKKIILLSAKGKIFNQNIAKKLSKLEQIILICGHYEGVDERVKKFIDLELSIGKYVLTGGELPAMVIVDAVSRLIPGVIKKESLKEESFSKSLDYLEYPQYTRPEIFDPKKIVRDTKNLPKKFQKLKPLFVPKILLSGHHQKIKEWREKHSKKS
ncbi:MAG: tRNA (guanosine(37)-N1)-methyltransferase TrmD [Candidatus Pacebacteria bacterium]|nr:tRNA (guanosine(37)-N1)-methyltransferase TrmD [Candidatus Paceibacterota bacterium]